jgi:mono/diheme cytochrome c family protein
VVAKREPNSFVFTNFLGTRSPAAVGDKFLHYCGQCHAPGGPVNNRVPVLNVKDLREFNLNSGGEVCYRISAMGRERMPPPFVAPRAIPEDDVKGMRAGLGCDLSRQ